jgi:ComF family protein
MTLQTSFPSPRELWRGFLHLIYPELCAACGSDMPGDDSCFCLRCQLKAAVSDMYLAQENEFTGRFWGRLQLERGAALYYFARRSPIQRALHQLKYRNKPDIGSRIGRAFGKKLLASGAFQTVDVIVPVPLHAKKERLRGYNQSALFAEGLGDVMGIPVQNNVLVRRSFTGSQTKKKRMERFDNVGSVFALERPQAVANKHVLLVDDVLTTGATLEECGRILLQTPGTRLSMATIAIALKQ